jgi:WD40 repeat protein
MSHRSSGARDLLANIVSRARQQAPLPLHVACGLGGGGEALVRALWDAAEVELVSVSQEAWDSAGGPGGICHRGGGNSIVDRVRCEGIGPSPGNASQNPGDGWCIVLSRDRTGGAISLASCAGPDAEKALFCELLREACSISPEDAEALAARLGFPTAVLCDLKEMRDDWRDASLDDLYEACLAAPTVAALRRRMVGRDGRALLDLGRVVCLMDPREVELSDEWALLAKSLSGRPYSVSDISLVVDAYPGLFEVGRSGRHTVVKPSSRLASALLLGGVTPSSSEHFAIYRALRDRSQAALERPDESDGFVAKHLPRQAGAAAALPELTSDPLAVLCSDPFALLRELETQPGQLRRPAGKVIALSAHRLLDGPDQASQLELSARRIGLYRFADTLASALPNRRWRPLWAQAELSHTHRVALNHRAPLLSVAAVEHPEGMAFVGSADGEVWRISPYRHPTRLAGSRSLEGEIRAIAASRDGDRELVAIGTSTHAVGVLDGGQGNLEWLDNEAHKDPLSAAAIHAGDEGTLLTAGVGGVIYAHPLRDGKGRGQIVYEHGSEIRGLQAIRFGTTDLIVFCAVDGVVGIVSVAGGVRVARWHMAEEVLNSVAARVEGQRLRLVVGTSEGSLRQLRVPVEALALDGELDLRDEPWDVLAQHPLAVNSVQIVCEGDDDFAVVSGASDGSWQWSDRRGTQQVGLGHVGPIWSVDCLSAGDRRYIVTAGGEGACRLWLTDAVLHEKITHAQPLAHRGPVSAIELAVDPAEQVLVLTGGSDGDVRVGAPSLAQGGELLTRHDSEISALISVTIDDVRSHVVSGSVDGALRLTPVSARRQRESTVLGIAHEGVTALSSGALGTRHEVVSGGRDGTITSWNLDTRTPNKTVQGCRYGSVQALCHIEGHGDGMLVAGGQDGGLGVFHGPMLEKRGEPSMLDASVLCLCPLPSSTGVLAGLADGRVAVVRELGLYGESVSYIEASENEIRGLGTLILGGRVFMACAGLDRQLRLLDIQAGEEAIAIELDGYALSLKAIGSAVGLGTSAGAAVISYPTDILVLNP